MGKLKELLIQADEMAKSPIKDAKAMAYKYGFDELGITPETIKFRMQLLTEEYDETMVAFANKNPEEWIDGHIDLIVIALGSLLHAGVDPQQAWDEVHRANMSKVRGVNPKRPESGGNDLYKPEGWRGPDHSDNYGYLKEVWRK